MKVKEESEKVGLKLNIRKTKIMVTGPITSWQRDGETVQIVSHFILGEHQGLFQRVNSLHEVAKVLEFQLQDQSFQEYSGLIF